MSKPYDATLKHLVEAYPADWVRYLGLPVSGPVEVVDADLSTVSPEADKVIRVGGALPYLLHLEFQASRDPTLSRRTLKYNVLLHDRHDVPVVSVVILLRSQADGAELTGRYSYRGAEFGVGTVIEYRVLRVWELQLEVILDAGPGLLPLAPLTDEAADRLSEAVQLVRRRVDAVAEPAIVANLWTSVYILMGLRYVSGVADSLLEGVRNMRESVTYQAILEEGRTEGRTEGLNEGRAQEARRLILLQGSHRFGAATDEVRSRLGAVSSPEQLEALGLRLLQVESWEELFAG